MTLNLRRARLGLGMHALPELCPRYVASKKSCSCIELRAKAQLRWGACGDAAIVGKGCLKYQSLDHRVRVRTRA